MNINANSNKKKAFQRRTRAAGVPNDLSCMEYYNRQGRSFKNITACVTQLRKWNLLRDSLVIRVKSFQAREHVRTDRPTSCQPPMCPFCTTSHGKTPLFLYVNKPKKTSLTSHTMSHSAQFHTSSIPLCPKSFWKIKRIVLELGRKAISVLWSLYVQFQKHMIHHFCLAPGTPGALSTSYFCFYTRFHQTRNARISSRIESTDLCSSDAKLIYREEQQPFWNVRGVQSRHGTLANYCRSRLSLHSTRTNLVNELYAASISTRMVTKHHFVFPLKLSKTT